MTAFKKGGRRGRKVDRYRGIEKRWSGDMDRKGRVSLVASLIQDYIEIIASEGEMEEAEDEGGRYQAVKEVNNEESGMNFLLILHCLSVPFSFDCSSL